MDTNVLILGAGSIGLRHARVLRDAGYAVGILSARPEARAALRGEGWTVGERPEDFPGCRHAIVATRTGNHVNDTLAVLAAGMDVLVEKPLAVDATAGRRMAGAAAAAGRSVFCALNLRFSLSLNRFRSLRDCVGRLHAAHVECRSYLPDWRPGTDYRAGYSASAEDGGVLRDLVHEIDYAGWILGWPERVFARFDRTGRLGLAAEEAAYLDCVLADGANVQIDLDFLTRRPIRRMVLFGDQGTLTWDGIAQTTEFLAPDGAGENWHDPESRDENLLRQDRAFLERDTDRPTALEGRPPCRPPGDSCELVTAEEALRGLAVCDAARRSADSRRDEPVIFP